MQPLGLEGAAAPLDLDHVVLEHPVRRDPQILRGELLERRPQHPHAPHGIERTFGSL
jgi:hypothetical protein